MTASVAADLIVLSHLTFIGFVAFGGLLAVKWRWLAWLHIPCLLWGVLIAFGGWICPLTPMEQRLRIMAGEGVYRGSFIDHYITPLIYPEGLTRPVQIILGMIVLALNLMVYGTMVAFDKKRTHD